MKQRGEELREIKGESGEREGEGREERGREGGGEREGRKETDIIHNLITQGLRFRQ